ncbi:MAG: amidase family protein [Lautropia sp.]|nr:amidase family protein [Lautropia sp.]
MKEWMGASAEALAAAYTNGRLSPVELLKAVFEHIEATEPRLGAMRHLCREAALETAQASEKRWQRRSPLSPLDGVPVTLREDVPLGSSAEANEPASPVVARLHEAGCPIIGTTVMSADDTLAAGLTADGRLVRNPWQPSASTGGSSAGAAAACAAGYAPLHVAYDRFGSVRLPAAFCGVVGFKPSMGRVPIAAPAPGRVAGIISRHIHDTAALMNILSRPDERDFMALPADATEYRMQVDGLSPKSLSIAVITDLGLGLPLAPAIQKYLQVAARALQMAGAAVDMIDSFISPALFDEVQQFWEAMAHADAMAGHSPAGVSHAGDGWAAPASAPSASPGHDGLAAASAAGGGAGAGAVGAAQAFVDAWRRGRASKLSGLDVMRAWQSITAVRASVSQAMHGYDFVLMPTVPVLPYAAEALSPTGRPQDGLPHIGYTALWNLSEHPAATVNWTHTDQGLPVGLQVVGHRFDDLGVLRLSRTLEIMRPEPEPWPEV